MSSVIEVLPINRSGSDGDGRKWPKHHYVRNDEYFKERLASDKWIKDLPGGPQSGVTYRLDKLPNGYAGFERARPDSKHIDRYVYGHPNGIFRSLTEFYPHFKHLMDHSSPDGCTCKLCNSANGNAKKAGDPRPQATASSSGTQSHYFVGEQDDQNLPKANLISPFTAKSRDVNAKDGCGDSDDPRATVRKLVDSEGTLDVYEAMINKVKDAGSDGFVEMPMEERMSPDWRSGNDLSTSTIQEWQDRPRYIPRTGEIVLFIRRLDDAKEVQWRPDLGTFGYVYRSSGQSLSEQPKWEAGVVIQMPKEPLTDEDLNDDSAREQSVNYSGFRVEPLSEPGSHRKPFSKQCKHVPLHAIRPFTYYQECLKSLPEKDWHPSIKHALTVMSSFCVVGRYRYRGVWPNATVFTRGVYIGPELILLGDTIKLMPRIRDQPEDMVTDVMVVTAIRLRFVNLDFEDDGDSPLAASGLPYQTCLHISGRVFTLDPTRSFDRVGKVPIDPHSSILPAGLSQYGQWYHYSDPQKASAKIEIPYTRVFGRCFEDTAYTAWFGSQQPSSSRLGKQRAQTRESGFNLSRGLRSVVEARRYSIKNDKRIKSQERKTWFWGDTRIEQLDLHEVNGRFVGAKDTMRTKGEMAKWKTALKALDGKKGALEAYQAAKKEREAEKAEQATPTTKAYGMFTTAATSEIESTTEAENFDDEDAMEVDESGEEDEHEHEVEEAETGVDFDNEDNDIAIMKTTPKRIETISLDDSEEEDEMASNQLAELAKSIRTNDPRLR